MVFLPFNLGVSTKSLKTGMQPFVIDVKLYEKSISDRMISDWLITKILDSLEHGESSDVRESSETDF